MRNFSPEFSSHLQGEVTTLCRVFVLELSDARRFAFTDHDQPLMFDGLSAQPLQAGETEQRGGFDADSGAIQTVFGLELSRDVILDGALDGAVLSEHRVN